MLAALGGEEINRRFAAADRYLRDSGVFYRVYEDPAGVERPWPLSHMPLLIEPAEWQQLEAGLIQRAELLEAVLADAYGPARSMREGRLPAALIAGNPEFLRPLVGVAPPGGAHLRFYAVDVGRGADGRWWVLGDRAQAPSGAGYAIENRLALSRAMPDIYRATRVQRVAPFFQALQAELFALNRQDDARVCLLTPGPMNETYFEHAYLARYLGLLLVEGEDLTVRDDGVFIRTISGLRRTEVLLRRIDADFADPLELNAASRLGVAGLVQAVRDGKVVIINSLGAGLVEARAMLAFLPALAPTVLGAELAMPNVATWWLGRADMREEMIGKLDSMVDRARPSPTSIADMRLGSEMLGAKLDDAQRDELDAIDPRSRRRLRGAGSGDAVEHAGLARRPLAAAAVHAAPVSRQGRRSLAGDAGRFRAHRRATPMRAPSACSAARATADAWVLTHGPVARDDAAADSGADAGAARRPGCCRAAPPTICSGSGAMWNAPRRRCGSCAPSSTAWPRPTMRRRRSSPASAPCSPPGAPIPNDTSQTPAAFIARAALTRCGPGRIVAAAGRRRARRPLPSSATASRPTPGGRSTISPR